jgi:hypothetical protein
VGRPRGAAARVGALSASPPSAAEGFSTSNHVPAAYHALGKRMGVIDELIFRQLV